MDAMPDSDVLETREALLVKAAEAWVDDPALDPGRLGGGDSVLCYLRAYYHRVATEDLPSPSRLAAVAQAHAELSLLRPQGRALIQVRDPGHAHLDPVTPASLIVDIVTDDMPYLVDSVTTRLNRHKAEISLLVHPLLRVRRDVTGALREIVGVCSEAAAQDKPGDGAAATDELIESWIHVELEPPGDGVTAEGLESDLRHVLEDVRVAVEDAQRMAAVARGLAGDLGGAPGSDVAEFGDLLRWLAAGNFTFLGYREYELIRAPEGAGLRPVPGTGLGILRHDPQGGHSLRKLSTQVARRAQDPSERLVLAKANSRSTVYRANYLDYVSVKKLGPAEDGRARSPGSTASSACTPTPRTPRPSPGSRSSGASWPTSWPTPGCPPTATTARIWSRSSRTIRARSSSRSPPTSSPRSRWACCGCPSASRPGCSCAGTATAGTCPAWCTCRGTGTPPRSGFVRRTSSPTR